MALSLGELSGIISLNEKPAMSALGKVRQGMRDTASEGRKSTDKMQAQQAKMAAAVESAAASVSRSRQREKDAADAVRVAEGKLADTRQKASNTSAAVAVAESRLADVRKKNADGSSAVLAAENRLAQARQRAAAGASSVVQAESRVAASHGRVRAAQDSTAKSTRDLEMAQQRLATTSDQTSERVSSNFGKMSSSGNRTSRNIVRAFGLVTVGLTAVVPAAGAGGAALLAMAGSALTLAGSVKQLLGVSALAPAALFAVGSGAGVLMSAFQGMGEALKTTTEETGQAAATSKLDAMALADAARGVAQAERAAADQRADSAKRVADAKRALSRVVEDNAAQQEDALRRVAYAERDVESANRRVTDSQRNLNDARREAVDRIEDLNRSLEGAGLSEREAAIRLEEAQTALDEASAGETSSLEYRKLKLDLDQAVFGLEEAKDRTADLKAEQAQASKEGVKGNRRVLDAQEALADAQQASLDAVVARGEAVAEVSKVEAEGAERVADAQRDIADAAEGSARAQVQAAESVADAHRNLERVQIQQADAATKATEKSVEAMGKLTPAAQVAAAALLVAYGRLGDVQDIAQENFFDGFADPLLALVDTVIPQLERGVGRLATAYGAGAQTWLRALNRELGNGVLERMFDRSTEAAYILNEAIDPVVAALVTLTDVGMEYMPRLAGGIRDAATEFDGFIQQAADDGSLRGWIDDGIQGTKDLFSILGSVVGILDKLEDAARAGGIATTLGSVADGLDRIEASVGGEVFQSTMATIFAGARGGAEGLLAALGPIGEAFRVGGPALAEFLRLGGEIAGTFVGSMFTGLSDPNFGSGLTDFLGHVQDGVEELGPKLPGLFSALGGILESVAPIVEAFGPTAVEVLTIFAEGLGAILDVTEPFLTAMAGSPAAVGIFLGVIGSTAILGAMATFAGNLVGIGTAAKGMWTFLAGPAGWIIAGIIAVSTATTWFLTETETGQNLVKDSGWALYYAYRDISVLMDTVVKPKMTKAAGDMAVAFLDMKGDTVQGLADLRKGATDTSTWWATQFAGMKMSASENMLAIASSVLTGKGKLDTAFAGIKTGLALIPGYFDSAKAGVKSAWDLLPETVKAPIRNVVDKVLNNGLIKAFNTIPGVEIPPLTLPSGLAAASTPAARPSVPKGQKGPNRYFAKGGYAAPGWAVVGEEGPELVNFSEPGRVYTAKRSAQMLAGAAAQVDGCDHGNAATIGEGNMGGFFEGNAANIRRHGAYYLDVAAGMGPWNFKGAADLWDGGAGVKVKTGRGKHQGYARPLERGGGILGYATGNNIDMSPSWMGRLGATQRRTVAAHEMGHAMGLPHNSKNSIMQPNLGQMASVPTALDIRNLQALFPGGSGKAGDGQAAENPLIGLLGGLMTTLKNQYPGGGMFMDASAGLLTQGCTQAFSFIEDIKKGIGNIAGEVVGSIRDFFGGDAATMTPTLMDGGGWLRDTDGPQIVDHRRKKPDAFTPYDEFQQIKKDYANALSGSSMPSTVILRVGERDLVGYFQEVAVGASGRELTRGTDRLDLGGKYVMR